MVPTDPDFPFDMPKLDCSLRVPHDWPESDRPTIRVTNPDMPRGFQINVERGFDGLIESALKDQRPITLLGLMNSLDRNLERFLTARQFRSKSLKKNLSGKSALFMYQKRCILLNSARRPKKLDNQRQGSSKLA